MRRKLSLSLLAVSMCLLAVSPVVAAGRQAITIDAVTTFDDEIDTFTATGLEGCASGVVENGPANVQFTPAPGVFAGFKIFTCDADTGFILRLNARFGPGGSVGTWSVIAAWGDLTGMHGAGGLVGDPIENGILDQYEGSVVL